MSNKLKSVFLSLICLLLFVLPLFVQAMEPGSKEIGASCVKDTDCETCKCEGGVCVGTFFDACSSTRMIRSIYWFGVGIVGFAAVVVIVIAGIMYMQSYGDPQKITMAKQLISGALIGVVLLLFSWTILRTTNPALVSLREPQLEAEVIPVGGITFLSPKNGDKISTTGLKDSPFKVKVDYGDNKDHACVGPDISLTLTLTFGNNKFELSDIMWGDGKWYNLSSDKGTGEDKGSCIYGNTFDDKGVSGNNTIYHLVKDTKEIDWKMSAHFKNTSRTDPLIADSSPITFTVTSEDVCKDGTRRNTCVHVRTGDENDKPKYCDEKLELVNNYAICGCPKDKHWNAISDECEVGAPETCNDGTPEGQCSDINKGYKCTREVDVLKLKVACMSGICPCEEGQTCSIWDGYECSLIDRVCVRAACE